MPTYTCYTEYQQEQALQELSVSPLAIRTVFIIYIIEMNIYLDIRYIRYLFSVFFEVSQTVFQRKKYLNGYLSIKIPAESKSGPLKKRDKVSAYSSLLFIIEICPLEAFLEFDSDFFRNIKGYNVLLSYNNERYFSNIFKYYLNVLK